MRIAIVSTPFVRVPPVAYGGTELFVAELVEELHGRAHDLTLFATGDSSSPAALRALYPRPVWPPSEEVERRHARFSLEQIEKAKPAYDVVQVNSSEAYEYARSLRMPVVYTIHHDRVPRLSAIYQNDGSSEFIAISKRQLELEVPLVHATVIHHGVNPERYPPSPTHEGYVLHLGRFCPQKGTHIAIDAARTARVRLLLAGSAHVVDQPYYRAEVAPRLHELAEEVGEANHKRKIALLKGAAALLCPVQWEEPFGLAVIEAMLCGTPVIAFRRGSLPELIDEGITGSLANDADTMAQAIGVVSKWDRQRCAERARERFSAAVMADQYEDVFKRVRRRFRTTGAGVAKSEPAAGFLPSSGDES